LASALQGAAATAADLAGRRGAELVLGHIAFVVPAALTFAAFGPGNAHGHAVVAGLGQQGFWSLAAELHR